MPPKGGGPKGGPQKKLTQKDIKKQIEREKEQQERQQQAKEQQAKTPVPRAQPARPAGKKGVLSTKEIKARVAEERRKKEEEEERRKKEELERQIREEEERLALEQAAQQEQQPKRQRAEIEDEPDPEAQRAQIAEMYELLKAEEEERRRLQKEERDMLKRQEAERKLQEAEQKEENSWGGGDDSVSDPFGEDGAMARERPRERQKAAQAAPQGGLQDGKDMRSPIVCVLGHVDTGKTSILDKIRASTVQQREEGGITQQIGASFLSDKFIRDKTQAFPHKLRIDVPGLLIVDTPGHESFANLRSRGSSLADMTILVVDVMHGIEPQTVESIGLLRAHSTPFLIALNKIDRLYSWKAVENRDSRSAIDAQSSTTQADLESKYATVRRQLGEQGYFSDYWWNVKDVNQVVPIVPTSAHTGEGLCDLLALLVQFSQQQLQQRITYTDDTKCTILEVRKTEGFGFTLDCILVNGTLRRGSRIVMAGQKGPITSTIRGLLTPREAKEIREVGTSDYQRHESLQAAVGCKIAGEDLEYAVAGATVYVCEDEEDQEILLDAVMVELKESTVKPNSQLGVGVHGSSLGALEALVGYLRSENTQVARTPVSVSMVNIGPVTKQALQEISLQHERGHPEYAVILAFDVEVSKEMIEKAKELDVTIIQAKIIYHLYDEYWKFVESWHAAERERLKGDTVFPCVFNTIAVFHNRNPVIIGIKVLKGVLRPRQPLALPDQTQNGRFIGNVAGIESNHVSLKEAKAGEEVSVRIETTDNYVVGKGGLFDIGSVLVTRLLRKNIDILKLHYRAELQEWLGAVKQIKTLLKVQ